MIVENCDLVTIAFLLSSLHSTVYLQIPIARAIMHAKVTDKNNF